MILSVYNKTKRRTCAGGLFFVLAVFVLGVFYSAQTARAQSAPGFSLRAAVLKDVDDFSLLVRGAYKLYDSHSDQLLSEERSLQKARVTATQEGIKIDERLFKTDRLKLVPKHDATIYVNDRRYRGDVNILKTDKNRFIVVNVIELEQYVRGVLYHEVSHRWPLEALKAQAVAVRAYAIYRINQSKQLDYDVTSDIYSQVYGGRNSERYRTNIAVERTQNEVLTYKGDILPAYFHATCGGFTEDAGELWKHNLAPLKGVSCPYCVTSPHYRWKKNFRSKDVQDKLNAKGFDIGLIKDIQVTECDRSGRIRKLVITDRNGKQLTIPGKDFRDIIGPNLIRSNNYEVVMQGYYFDLIGKGWGHGVGLCQWGAQGMARQRHNYREILNFYYPGAEIVSYKKVNVIKK